MQPNSLPRTYFETTSDQAKIFNCNPAPTFLCLQSRCCDKSQILSVVEWVAISTKILLEKPISRHFSNIGPALQHLILLLAEREKTKMAESGTGAYKAEY